MTYLLPSTKRRILAVVATMMISTVGMALFPDAQANAASMACTTSGSHATDVYGNVFLRRTCSNWLKAPLYSNNYNPQSVVGYMYAGANWVACWQHGAENPTTTNANGHINRNNIWLWTQGDIAKVGFESYWNLQHGWTWMPATYVAQGDNYQVPSGVITQCPAIP